MEYICLCAQNTVNNGPETQKHVKKKGQTCWTKIDLYPPLNNVNSNFNV